MPIYYMFSHEQRYQILHQNGLSVYSSIYADGKIEEPEYDYTTHSFKVNYHVGEPDSIKWETANFIDKGQAWNFFLKKYREYQYEWSMMFYEEFKPTSKETKKNVNKPFDYQDVDRLLSRLQNLQNNRRGK